MKLIEELEVNSFDRIAKGGSTFWVECVNHSVGEFLFTFDKKIVFNLFEDYPYNLTWEQKQRFDRDCPYWCDFFKYDRPCTAAHLELKNKSVFDVCNDPAILNSVLPYVPTGCDKMQFYLGYYKDNPTYNALAMLEVAELMNDNALKMAIEMQFKEELIGFYNE